MPNRAAQVVLALAVFAAIGMVMLSPVSSVVSANTGTQNVTNESVTASYNQTHDLKGYDLNAGSVKVYGYNQTSGKYEVASSPADYNVQTGPGKISFNSSSSLIDSGENVKVSYDYQASGALTSLVLGFLPLGVGLLIFVGIANGVMRET